MIVGVLHALQTELAAFLALLLAASALHKLWRFRASLEAARALIGGGPARAIAALIAAIGGEALAGVLLLRPEQRSSGALLAALIFAAYLAAMACALARGRRAIDCGCHFGAARRALGAADLERNAVLIVLALATAVDGVRVEPLGAAQGLAALALLALYAALDAVMTLEAPRIREVM